MTNHGKNGMPIRRGVILIAGPNNPYYPPHWYFYLVDESGNAVDMNNNVFNLSVDEMCSMFVANLRDEKIRGMGTGLSDDELFHSGICAGCEDWRFGR